jgi:hypothetical protein
LIRDWLDTALATRLANAGFNTLAELAEYITLRGYRWYRPIARVGEQAALRILQWMTRNAADLGITLPEHSRLPRKAWSAPLRERVAAEKAALPGGIAPIEYFSPSCPTAQSDRVLLLQWLMMFRSSPSTYRAYRSQAERLLLWAALERGIGLSAMTAADLSAFFAFVTRADLPPQWRGPKAERQTAAWRPIEKPPSANSIAVARRILKLAFDYLCAQGHCTVNPLIESRIKSIPSALEQSFACDSMPPRAESAIEKTAQKIKTLAVGAVNRPSGGHPAERIMALARENGLLGSTMSSANHVPTRSTLRHVRLAVVHTLLSATAWPLSTLVQLRVEHIVSAGRMGEDPAGATLSFHDGRHMRRAHLACHEARVLADYFRLREVLGVSQPTENHFLIGRHSDQVPMQMPSPVTPNVLARAIRQYHLTHQLDGVPPPDDMRTEHASIAWRTRECASFRTFKRRAREQLRDRHAKPLFGG